MSERVLLYYGWLADFGFGERKPMDAARISDEQHKAMCSKKRDRPFTEMEGHESWVIPASLIVSFPEELEQVVNDYKGKIEGAHSFQEAVMELKRLVHELPCTHKPDRLEVYHSTHLPPEVVLKEGLFSPREYLDRFGNPPPKMIGQISGDGIYTTLEPQEQAYNVMNGKKKIQPRFVWGTSQYQITLDFPVVLLNGEKALSIIDWYIKLRHDFGLPVYEADFIQSHDIVAPTCNRLQGLPQFHKDMGYDVIDTEFEYLIKKRHIGPDRIKCVGPFSQ